MENNAKVIQFMGPAQGWFAVCRAADDPEATVKLPVARWALVSENPRVVGIQEYGEGERVITNDEPGFLYFVYEGMPAR